MAQVNVTIMGRTYRMTCDDGQEDDLLRLGKDLDSRIADLRRTIGEVGDTRLIIMAALTIADDLSDASKKLSHLQDEVADLQNARRAAADHAQATQAAIVAAFMSAAERIEAAARKLNQSVGTSGVPLG